jgi:acetyltransferase-like isoleucine patch superfamily enzyme
LIRIKREFLLQRPFGLGSIGPGSFIQRPRILNGRGRIHLGSSTHIFSRGLISAVSLYAGRKYDPTIRIGNGVYIGRYVYLTAAQSITICDNCVLSEHIYITDLNHGFNPGGGPIMQQHIESKGPVYIGPNCFVGYRAAIMPGVSLGEWCIVGANSVVTQSFPPYCMIGGSPAKVIKVYSHELGKWVRPDILDPKERGVL